MSGRDAATLEIVAGAYDATSAPTIGGRLIEGLERESTYLWGLFRSRADDPDIYQSMRRLSSAPSWPARLLLQSNAGSAGLGRHRYERMAARTVDVVSRAVASNMVFRAEPIDGAEPFGLVVAGHDVRWAEGAILDVAGREVMPGLQWGLVRSDGGDGMRYASRIFLVEGVVDGVPVDGFVGVDEVHLAPGSENYVDDPLTASHLSHVWCTWATAYDDGTVEAGHVSFGRDGFGFGLRAGDGVAHVAEHVAGEVTTNDRGCPTHVAFELDGQPWEFVADPRGLPVVPLPGPVRQAEGWFRRVGETRRPLVWCATPEVPAS